MEREHRIELTKDGSPTVVSGIYGAEYHSGHGALTESLHVFIEAGLIHWCNDFKRDNIGILEYGFGTGLNCWLTHLMLPDHIDCCYHTLELHPLEVSLVKKYSEFLFRHFPASESGIALFEAIHHQPWDTRKKHSDRFSLEKAKIDFLQFKSQKSYDLIFYDAFGPGTQPELWGEEVFAEIYNALDKNGLLVTYCVQGKFRRVLDSLGFKWEKLPGPPGKREMLRACKK